MDGLNPQFLGDIALLRDSISGINGISWEDIEPEAPQNGVHSYKLASEMAALKNSLANTGRRLQLNFRLASHWALERDPNTQVTDPGDGSKEDGIVRVKPEHEDDLAAVIQYMLQNMPVESLQVGSEAENEWLDGEEYVKAMSIIYEAAKEIHPDITIMAFWF